MHTYTTHNTHTTQTQVVHTATTYDAEADTILVRLTQGQNGVNIVLRRQITPVTPSKVMAVATPIVSTLAAGASAPSGSYKGAKSVLGFDLRALVRVVNDNTLDVQIAGPNGSGMYVHCPNVGFHMTGPVITISAAPDSCLVQALSEVGASLAKSITFDARADTVSISIKAMGMGVDFVLAKIPTLGQGGSLFPTAVATASPELRLPSTTQGTQGPLVPLDDSPILFGQKADSRPPPVVSMRVQSRPRFG